jgi:GNAT superfamily N-acetyltransferase
MVRETGGKGGEYRPTVTHSALQMLSGPMTDGKPVAEFGHEDSEPLAVFLSRDVPGGEDTAMRVLKEKLKDAKRHDKRGVFFEGRWLTSHDLSKKATHWHNFRIFDDGPDGIFAIVSYRLVLLSADEIVGFCTFNVQFSHWGQAFEHEVRGALTLESIFIDPASRGRGLSSRAAEVVVDLLMRHVADVNDCLKRANAVHLCRLQLTIEADAISEGGERFVENVKCLAVADTSSAFPDRPVGDALLWVDFLWDEEFETLH